MGGRYVYTVSGDGLWRLAKRSEFVAHAANGNASIERWKRPFDGDNDE